MSLSDTFLPATTLTVPPKTLASSRVMSLAEPALRLVVPVTLRTPLSVIKPLAVTARLPLIAEAPRSMAFASFSDTFLPLRMLTAPPKSLAPSSVMSLADPADRLVVPVISSTCAFLKNGAVIAPPAVTARLPVIVELANARGVLSLSATSPTELIATVPLNTLAAMRVIPLPALSVVLPGTVRAPSCVIAPEALTERSCPTLRLPTRRFTLPAVASRARLSPAVVVPARASVAPVSDTSPTVAVTLPLVARIPAAVRPTLPVELVTPVKVMPPASPIVMSPLAVAERLAASVEAVIEPLVDVSDSVPAEITPEPTIEPLPLVSESVPLPTNVRLAFTARLLPGAPLSTVMATPPPLAASATCDGALKVRLLFRLNDAVSRVSDWLTSVAPV